VDKLGKLNVGAGRSILSGWTNIDKVPYPGITVIDIDKEGLPFPSSSFDELLCQGCLSEFQTDVVTVMNWFWDVLCNGGILEIRNAVVDNGNGAFRDPMARRYLHSQWVEYFYIGGAWENSGYGFGFRGKFEMVLNEVSGETHHVILRAVK